MKRSYQVIELEILDSIYNNERDSLVSYISLLSWLSFKLNKELFKRNINVEIDVIKVSYVSTYPAFGAYYKDQEHRKITDDDDIEDLVIDLCKNYINNSLFIEYSDYLSNHKDLLTRDIENYNKN